MEFRLLYQGQLLGTSRGNTRADHKHAIRRSFHPQLRRLWMKNNALQRMAWQFGCSAINDEHQKDPSKAYPELSEEQTRAVGFTRMGDKWNRNGFHFVPLVTEDLMLSCSIDVLFLRPEEPHLIFTRGDLDARIKTIFDSLRIPSNLEEAGGQGPAEDEDPFFCLLSDDKLVSEVRVSTDQLLALPGERKPNANDCFMLVHVRLKPRQRSMFSWVFE